MVSRRLLIMVSAIIGLFLTAQIFPFGRTHTNPPLLSEPDWDSPMTRYLAEKACFNCHSNETKWPWYAEIAPISWMIQYKVQQGREVLNFSEWSKVSKNEQYKRNLAEAFDQVMLRNAMPPMDYLLLHPSADLGTAERDQLLKGLKLTIKRSK